MKNSKGNRVARYLMIPVVVLLWMFSALNANSHASVSRSGNEGNFSQSTPGLHLIVAKAETGNHTKDTKAHVESSKKGTAGKSSPKTSHSQVSKSQKIPAKESSKNSHSQVSKSAGKEQTGTFTAYTAKSAKRASDGKTADGSNLKAHSCVLANNELPIGTIINIEGIGSCEVRDRIGKKVGANHFDINLNENNKWAKTFGKKKLRYTIEKRGETTRS